jgi:hypothetical protein
VIESQKNVLSIFWMQYHVQIHFNWRVVISTMYFFPLQQIICNAYRMILRFFLDIVNGQEAQQIIIKLLWAWVPLNEIQYHRSCYKAYTSKINLQRFVSDVPECSNTSNDALVSTMKTRSKTLPQINWDYWNDT